MKFISRDESICWPVISNNKKTNGGSTVHVAFDASAINLAHPIRVEGIHRLEASKMEIL
jgi:hypothetical protein